MSRAAIGPTRPDDLIAAYVAGAVGSAGVAVHALLESAKRRLALGAVQKALVLALDVGAAAGDALIDANARRVLVAEGGKLRAFSADRAALARAAIFLVVARVRGRGAARAGGRPAPCPSAAGWQVEATRGEQETKHEDRGISEHGHEPSPTSARRSRTYRERWARAAARPPARAAAIPGAPEGLQGCPACLDALHPQSSGVG
jgi:hypothetical protein